MADISSDDASSTCWTLIRDAAAGEAGARETFVSRYQRVVLAYLRARWSRSLLIQEIDDACQDVFFECFKSGGALGRADPARGPSFRAFLFSISRNVASRFEERQGRQPGQWSSGVEVAGRRDEGPDRHFQREWARSVVEEALRLQRERARLLGSRAEVRMKILRLRFVDGLPIRDLAPRVGLAAEAAHREYAVARREFEDALKAVVAFDTPGGKTAIENECREILAILKAR